MKPLTSVETMARLRQNAMHGSPQTTQALCVFMKLVRARCSAAVHVVGEDLVPLAIPKQVQMNIVLTHDARLIISER